MQLARIPVARRAVQLAARRQPDLAFFESWHGTYSDSPRAIAEELDRRGSPIRQVWVIAGDAPELPATARTIAPDGRDYLQALGAARYVFANNSLPGYFRKRPGTTYVQTWHGTPLKRIAFDIPRPAFRGSEKYLRNLRADVDKWDLLVSPNPFSTDVLTRAFRYRGRVLETGYPRNDLLASPEAGPVRAHTRRALDVADGVRAVLYAPTWRDDDPGFSTELDLERLMDDVGPDYVLLLRAHHLVAATTTPTDHPRIRDVSAVPDIRELYLAADVLVTDYSSVAFDFAVTGKPILFFTYDLERYRDRLRGFYLDLEAEAPGPLLATTGELVQALRDLEAVVRRHAGAYRRFTERFCALEDGHAAARVVDAVLGASAGSGPGPARTGRATLPRRRPGASSP